MSFFKRPLILAGLSAFQLTSALAQSVSYTFITIDDPLANSGTAAFGVNNSGQIVGHYYIRAPNEPLQGFGFVDTSGVFNTVGPTCGLFSVSATGINDAGQIIGYCPSSNGWLETNGVVTTFNPPTSPYCVYTGCGSIATDLAGINDAGQIVGTGQGYGFLYSAGTFTFFTLPFTPTGISDVGQIIGTNGSDVGTQVFLYSGGTLSTVNTSTLSANVNPTGINTAGLIVGYYTGADGVPHGFLDNAGSFTTIDEPLAGSGQGTSVNGINDAGQIVGSYVDANGNEHGFLATPVAASGPPTLTITKAHSGNFTLGQQGATYTVTVSNAPKAGSSFGTVTVTERLPLGFTLVSMAGSGWTCPQPGNTCTRGDGVLGGTSYPPITVTVNVAANATSPQVNAVMVSGGGSVSASASDSTIITPLVIPVGTLTEYVIPTSASVPVGITAGPDGALWFTENAANKIGRITTGGAITEYPIPTANSGPYSIAAGPDAALWFTEANSGKIGRVTTGGGFSEFPLPSASSYPIGVIAGEDGALWFTEWVGNKIGRITTTGSIAEYSVPTANATPNIITTGPDGNLWFTEFNGGKVGSISTTGNFGEYTVPAASQPSGIITGPDGALWFVWNINSIGRITTGGSFTQYNDPGAVGGYGITAALDGALWFDGNNNIGRITTAGSISQYPASVGVGPVFLTVGSDGAVWFTESSDNAIGSIYTGNTVEPALIITKTHSEAFAQGQQNATYTVIVSNASGAASTSGTVTANEAIPSGLTLASMSGVGWTCTATTCSRNDALAGGASYPAITVMVNVAANATSPQVNQVSVSGGGSASASAIDSTVISPSSCAITLSSQSASLPATGTSTVETCPNNSGQPNCGVSPEVPVTFTVSPSAACGQWTAASSDPEFLQITSGGSGSGTGTVGFTLLNNTHTSPQNYTITLSSGASTATYNVMEAGSGNSQVYREVYALYEQLLGRDPDPSGFAFWTGSGGAGLGQMADSFLTSPEAFNSDFAVMAAYQAATNAPPTYAQYAAAVASIPAATQTVPGLFNSLIGSGYTMTTLYQNLLNRAPTATDSSCTAMALANCFQTIIGYPSSVTPVGATNNEFQNTGSYSTGPDHSDALYVQMIYYVTLSRDPDPAGFAFWLGVANSGGPGILFQGAAGYPTRIQILGPGTPNQGFIGSPEFQGLFAN
ncbi:MAG TPA: DUF4214 domain-containing protein [Bryobacteraceae bacterium]|nr:DUF4214 domain-containing protein [Bryobacteraceae bacterium]